MPLRARKRAGQGRLRGGLVIAACLVLLAAAAPPAHSIETPAADAADAAADDIAEEAIPPPVPDVWEPEFAAAGSSCTGCSGIESGPRGGRFYVDYDNGFAILPRNPHATPFSLRIRNQNMFRYDGFGAATSSWTDSAGNVIPINNSNYFGIPRGRLIFEGDALLPRLSYLLNIDYNSVTNQPIGFRAFWLSYRFSKAFELYVGQSKVPGSREWIESAFASLQSADRTMATTFFRPSLSQGVWVMGEPLDGFFYHAMMSNGFNTLNLIPEELNNRFAWSGSAWWEPWSAFGRGYSDLQHHEDPAVRLGACYTFALGSGSQAASDAVENSPVRLSDGTIITTPGALAPGVTLRSYDISLAAIDWAWKYRGLGLSSELYFQNLSGFQGTGPLPLTSTSAFGGFVKGGYFLVPRETELYARSSYVTGGYGSGYELGGGFNHFFLPGKDNLFFTFDTAWLQSSPAGQNRTGFVAGQTGLLIRAQIVAVF